MKKIFLLVCVAALLAGCGAGEEQLDRAMVLRADMIAQALSFDAQITADYGSESFTFCMFCSVDTGGSMTFRVTEPSAIAGISGTVDASGGKLTFDDAALGFELMADGQISPVSAPWVLIRTLRGGYLTSCTQEEGSLRISIDDSYELDALHLDIWLDEND